MQTNQRVGYEVDINGDPVIYRIKGYDQNNPDAIYMCRLEMWGGGRAVFKAFDPRPITVASDPIPPPDYDEVIENRKQLAQEARAREAQALREERERAIAEGRVVKPLTGAYEEPYHGDPGPAETETSRPETDDAAVTADTGADAGTAESEAKAEARTDAERLAVERPTRKRRATA